MGFLKTEVEVCHKVAHLASLLATSLLLLRHLLTAHYVVGSHGVLWGLSYGLLSRLLGRLVEWLALLNSFFWSLLTVILNLTSLVV